MQFFIAIQNWSIKNRKIFTFLKEPVNFPIFFIKFLVQNCALCVKKMWKSDMHSTCRICVPTLFSMLSRIFFVKLTLLFFLWFVYKMYYVSVLVKQNEKKKYLRPFQDYIMSVLTYLQSALSNYCIYLVFYFYFLFLTSLSV